MTKKLVGWFVLLPLCVVLAVFALANRHVVEVRFDPLSATNPLVDPIEVPMFLVIYAMLIAGVILGGIASWFAQGKQRREKRQWRKRARELEEAGARPTHPDGGPTLSRDLPIIEGP